LLPAVQTVAMELDREPQGIMAHTQPPQAARGRPRGFGAPVVMARVATRPAKGVLVLIHDLAPNRSQRIGVVV